jgi:hypothetical protein
MSYRDNDEVREDEIDEAAAGAEAAAQDQLAGVGDHDVR